MGQFECFILLAFATSALAACVLPVLPSMRRWEFHDGTFQVQTLAAQLSDKARILPLLIDCGQVDT